MKTVILIVCLLSCGPMFAADGRTQSGSAEIHWGVFTRPLKDAKKVVAYLGTSRRGDEEPKPTVPTVKIDDFEFYREPLAMTRELAAKLTEIGFRARFVW